VTVRGPLALVRDAWWAASAPTSFYRALQAANAPRLARACTAAAVSVVLACAALALAFVRATESDGFLLAWAFLSAVALPLLAMLLLLGGLVMVRPAALDLRAWEISAWAWVPAGALAVSLTPAALIAPVPAVVVGVVAWPFWHVALVASGVAVFAAQRRVVSVALYLVAVFVVPGLLLAVSYAVMSGMAGA
jgi:hypothetical protein